MQPRRFALSMSVAIGLIALGVVPARATDQAQTVDCTTYAGLNLDAAAGRDLKELIDCHDALSKLLDCHEGVLPPSKCGDVSEQLREINAEALRRLNVALANDERALRRQANELTEANETRKKLMNELSTNSGGLSSKGQAGLPANNAEGERLPVNTKQGREVQKGDVSDQMVSAANDLKLIESRVAYSEKKLFVNSEDYEDYFFRLNAGYEFVAIDSLFSKGTPRVSLLVNSKIGGDAINDRIAGFHFYGIRFNLAATLNSSAEATPSLPTDNASAPQEADDTVNADTSDVKQSLEVELQTVIPFVRTRLFTPNNLRSYFSLITVVGGIKTDEESRVNKRYYGGLRFSINPELFGEFLIGRTESLKSLRFEYRGQLPVYTLASGDRIFLGFIANLGLNKKKEKESDAFRVYVSWNTDIKKLFSSGDEGS
jgi:hypothetical protein